MFSFKMLPIACFGLCSLAQAGEFVPKNFVEIRPSQRVLAGRGLFATRDIAADTFLAIYAGEISSNYAGDSSFAISLGEGCSLIGNPHPQHPQYAAQLANDPYVYGDDIKFLSGEHSARYDDQSIKKFIMRYLHRQISDLSRNGNHLQNTYLGQLSGSASIYGLYSYRTLAAGEEIYYAYGINYWINFYLSRLSGLETTIYRSLLTKWLNQFIAPIEEAELIKQLL